MKLCQLRGVTEAQDVCDAVSLEQGEQTSSAGIYKICGAWGLWERRKRT